MKWTNEETERLKSVVEAGWDWHFPGWKWVAMKFDGRTAEACRKKIKWIYDKESGK